MPLHPETKSSLASCKSRLVLPFWYWLTQVVLEERPLNRCSNIIYFLLFMFIFASDLLSVTYVDCIWLKQLWHDALLLHQQVQLLLLGISISGLTTNSRVHLHDNQCHSTNVHPRVHLYHRHRIDKYLDTLLANQTPRKAVPPTIAKSRKQKMRTVRVIINLFLPNQSQQSSFTVIGYAEAGQWRSPMTCRLLQCTQCSEKKWYISFFHIFLTVFGQILWNFHISEYVN